MRRVRHASITTLIAGAVVLGAAGPAAAAVDAQLGVAAAEGAVVDLLGLAELVVGASDAAVGDTTASATGTGLSLLPDTTSTAASSDATTVTDPATGDRCALPVLPAPLDTLDVDLVCSSATATGGATPSAAAEATLLHIGIDGALVPALVDFIVDNIAGDLTAQIDAALDPLEDTAGPLLDPVVSGLAEQCAAGVQTLTEVGSEVVDPVLNAIEDSPLGEQFPTAVDELNQALEGTSEVLPPACAELIELLADLPSVEAVLDTVADALRDALADLELVDLIVGGSVSSSTTSATEVVNEARSLGAALTLPAIGDLTELLDAIVGDVVGGAVGELSGSLADEFDDLVPTIEVLLQPVLDALELPDLLSANDPLLSLIVGPSSATTTLDRVTGVIDTEGSGSVVTVTLSQAFAALLGEENTSFEIGEGESMSLFEGTPLESSITMATPADAERRIDGLLASGTVIDPSELSLLQGLEGGITLGLTSAEALAAGAVTAAAPPPAPETPGAPNLPRTGGGAALLALPLLGVAAGLRRRRS